MLRFLQELAEENKIPFQLKQPMFGGTNAGEIHLSGKGVLTGVLAAPCRYLHGPSSILDLNDLNSLVDLTVAALEAIPGKLFLG